MLAHQRRDGLAGELAIRLVHHDQRIGAFQNADQKVAACHRSRGVVGAGDDGEVDIARGKAVDNGLLVDGVVIPAGHIHHVRAGQIGVGLVHGEGGRDIEHLAPGTAPGKRQVEQELVAAVTHEHVIAIQSLHLGDRIAQVIGQGIGIAVEIQAGQAIQHGLQHRLGDALRILVRRKHHAGGNVLGVVRDKPVQQRIRSAHLIHRCSPA